MRWFISRDGDVEGPMDGVDVRVGIDKGTIGCGSHVRDDAGGTWMPIEQSPFGAMFGGGTAGTEGSEERLGYALLLVPLGATALVWLWVAQMNLLQDPAGTLIVVSLVTVGLCALIVAIDAGQLGMGRVANSKGKKDSGPVAWFFATVLLFLFVHPWYLAARGKYGRKNMVFGGALSALVFSGSVLLVGAAVENKKTEVRASLASAQQEAQRARREFDQSHKRAMAEIETTGRVAALWSEYDMLPDTEQTNEALKATLQAAAAIVGEDTAWLEGRRRLAHKITELGRATGEDLSVFEPSPLQAECVRAVQQLQKTQTWGGLKDVGFKRVACGDQSWEL